MENNPFFQGKSHLYKLLFLFLFVIIGFSISNIIAIILVSQIWDQSQINILPEAIRLVLFLSSMGIFFFPAYLYLFLEKNNFSKTPKKPVIFTSKKPFKDQSKSIIITGILSFFIILVIGLIGEWNQQIHFPDSLHKIELWMRSMEDSNQETISLLTAAPNIGNLLLNLIFMAILPAICEEIFFRGVLQQTLISLFKNRHIAILVTAIIFSTIHFQFFGFFPRLLLGIYLGYLTVWSGSLLLPVIAHFFHNAVSLIITFMSEKAIPHSEELNISDLPGIALLFVISASIISIGIYNLYKDQMRIRR
ncbi:MAG TPA: CPBP family intramembrane metalloprotease [Bacteroidales bacterium]|nr:CPBP family intramembrane metalloprotease [Bacteroidales bacterium]